MKSFSLYTERLIIRPMLTSDADIVVDWRNSERILSTTQSKLIISVTTHLKWFETSRNDRIDSIFALRDNPNVLIGSFSYSFFDTEITLDQGQAFLGKYIGNTSCLGKGYANEGMRAWLKFGFNDLKLSRIYSRTLCTNTANIKLNQKLGFDFFEPEAITNTLPSPDWRYMSLDSITYASINCNNN